MRGYREQRRRGSTRPAKVLRVYTLDGLQVADVIDNDGSVWLRCRFVGQGGGGSESYVRHGVPPAGDEAEVLLGWLDGAVPFPVILGTLASPKASAAFSDVDPPGPETDYPAKNGLRDEVIAHGGARIVLSSQGDLVLDTTRSDKPVRVQLPPGGRMRISREGEADERLLLAGPTQEHIDALAAHVDALAQHVTLLTSILQSLAAATAVPVAPATLPTWGASLAQVLQPTPPYPYSPSPRTSDALVASAVAISRVSAAEE